MNSSKSTSVPQDVDVVRPATWYHDHGYATAPIMPPDADVSPLSKSVYKKVATPKDPRGKVPGFIGDDGKWRSYNYRGDRRTRAQLVKSDQEGASVGLLTGEQPDGTYFVGVDPDTLDRRHATLFRDAIDKRFGKQIVRVGQSPKALYPLRLSAPPPRMTIRLPDDAGHIEIIAETQFVVEGVHPRTGENYTWPRGRLGDYSDLVIHDPTELYVLFSEVAAAIPGARLVVTDGSTKYADVVDGDSESAAERKAPSVRALERVLAQIPNDHEHAPAYEGMIRLGNNIKAAGQDDPGRALELFLEKAAEWEGPHGETNDPDEMEGKFRTFKADRCGGYPTLVRMAQSAAGPDPADKLQVLASIYFADEVEVAAAEAEEAAFRASGKVRPRTLIDDMLDAVRKREQGPERSPRDVFGDGAELPDLPPPDGAASKVLADYAAEVAELSGADPALTLASGIAAAAAAVGYRLAIQPKQHDTRWKEGGTLWVALVADPGSKKSPAMGMMIAPLSEIDAAYVREDGPRLAEYLERKSKRRKGEPDPGQRPRVRRAVVNGTTFEALTGILADNPTGVLMVNDELTGFLSGFNQYKSGGQGSDRALALSLFDGREARVDRAGKGLTYVERFGASQLGGIQPDKLRPLVENLGADGLLQRYLPIIGSRLRRRGADRPPNAKVEAAYSSAIKKVAAYTPAFADVVQLTPGARGHWDSILDRVDNLAGLPGLSGAWLGHLGKWPAFAARLMLIAHVFDNIDRIEEVDRLPVSGETAARTERLAGWFLLHSLRFYSTFVGVGQAADDARWIAGWLLSRPPRSVVHRGVLKQDYGAVRNDSARAARAMDFLAANDWCRSVGRYDRDGATEWEIFPEVYDGRFKSRSEVEERRRAEARRQIEIAAEERRSMLAEQNLE